MAAASNVAFLGQPVEDGPRMDCYHLGTPFSRGVSDVNAKMIAQELSDLGYEAHGNEVMYNGFTGRKLNAQVFIGPTYYQRLKHLVEDKIYSRNRGVVTVLTRQPTEGRIRFAFGCFLVARRMV